MSHFPFQRLQADLAAIIANSPAGTRLPSEPNLAADLGVSRATLREAMRTFEAQGLIRRRQGAGTFVVGTPPVIESGLEALESMLTLARRSGLEVGPGPSVIEQVKADAETAAALGLAEGAGLVRISRTMRAATRPVAYLVDSLPEAVLQAEELSTVFSGSVLDYLLQRGDPLVTSRAEITAINASSEVAKKLEIQRSDVLLKLTAVLFTASGQAIDFSHSYFLPGYFKFHVVRKVAQLIG